MSSPWTHDGLPYLADIRHPLFAEEYRRRQAEKRRRYDEGMPPRERRQFDRDMVLKFGKAYPPPARTPWVLMSFDIQDAAEERAARLAKPVETVRVPMGYIDEDLF